MYFLIFALIFQALAGASSVLPTANATEYMACDIPEIDRLIIMSNWTAQRRNGIEQLKFHVSSTVSDYEAECHGTREGDGGTGWIICDEPTEDVYVLFSLDGRDWLQLHYRYLCDGHNSTDTRPLFGLLSRSLYLSFVVQELPDGNSTRLEEDPLRLNTNAHLQVPPPRTNCSSESREDPQWEVSRFEYTTMSFPGNPILGGGGGVLLWAGFDFTNSANGLSMSCQNSSVSSSQTAILDPTQAYSCFPFAWIGRDGQYHEWEGYPTTIFWFNRTDNVFTLEQTWVCDDNEGGHSVSFKGSGKAVLPLECQPRSQPFPGTECAIKKTAIPIDVDEF
ncbi:hypothetical protein GGS26DRAFT_601646 [Hypomontagnella submonticulosa]|nr:hypothetical protein GGS26DRAFT_601646 [Hypomontagnella submonticulosa]